MRGRVLVGLIAVLSLATLAMAGSADKLLAIIDDVNQPLVTRRKALKKLDRLTGGNRALCGEMAKRAGYDPIGKEISYYLRAGSPCQEAWGEAIAKELLEDNGLEQFILWDWLSCDYLASRRGLTRRVGDLNNFHVTETLAVCLGECRLDELKKELLGASRPKFISYSEGTRTSTLYYYNGYSERSGDLTFVYVRGLNPEGQWPSEVKLYITSASGNDNVEAVLYRWGARGCSFLGTLSAGGVHIDHDRLTLSLRDAAFEGAPCGEPAEVSTIRVSAEDLPQWPVSGLYDYLGVPATAPELVPELKPWR